MVSLVPAVADVQQRALTTDRQFTTQVAGLFLFVPQLLALDLPDAVRQAGLARFGSHSAPARLSGLAAAETAGPPPCISHISDLCADEGAGSLGRTQRPAQDDLRHRLVPTAPTAPCTNASSRP